jgi:hypothetical protein
MDAAEQNICAAVAVAMTYLPVVVGTKCIAAEYNALADMLLERGYAVGLDYSGSRPSVEPDDIMQAHQVNWLRDTCEAILGRYYSPDNETWTLESLLVAAGAGGDDPDGNYTWFNEESDGEWVYGSTLNPGMLIVAKHLNEVFLAAELLKRIGMGTTVDSADYRGLGYESKAPYAANTYQEVYETALGEAKAGIADANGDLPHAPKYDVDVGTFFDALENPSAKWSQVELETMTFFWQFGFTPLWAKLTMSEFEYENQELVAECLGTTVDKGGWDLGQSSEGACIIDGGYAFVRQQPGSSYGGSGHTVGPAAETKTIAWPYDIPRSSADRKRLGWAQPAQAQQLTIPENEAVWLDSGGYARHTINLGGLPIYADITNFAYNG